MDRVVTKREMLEQLERHYGPIEPVVEESSATADRFRLPDGLVFGIISSTTEPFCGSCDRSRLTADGHFYTCLYAREGLDVAGPIRAGASEHELAALVAGRWRARRDRGAEERLGIAERGSFAEREELRRDPRLEMHTRGG